MTPKAPLANAHRPSSRPRAKREAFDLPLTNRLPNPAPAFVGRTQERRVLSAAIQRSPVTSVFGLGGLGKSTLVVETLHGDFADRMDRTLLLAVRPNEAREQVLIELARVLGRALGYEERSWSRGLLHAEQLVPVCVDLADEASAVVVLEDVHHAEGPVRELLVAASRYARRSRWLAVGRIDLALSLPPGQSIALEAMPGKDLERLAVAWLPSLGRDRAEAVIAASQGSPFWLKQELFSFGADARSREADLTQGLTEGESRWLAVAAELDVAFHPEAIASAHEAPAASSIERLKSRGLLESFPHGLRVHEVARSVFRSARRAVSDSARHELASCLAASADTSLVLESLRLHADAGHSDGLLATLSARRNDLFEAGHAPQVWQLFARLSDPSLRRLKLDLAVELGGGAPLAWAVAEPAPEDLDELLLWTKALFVGGKIADAAAFALRAGERARAEGRPDVAFEADLAAARSLTMAGKVREAEELFRKAAPRDSNEAARRDIHLARALVLCGEREEALALVGALRASAGLSDTVRREVASEGAAVLGNLGRLRAAGEMLAHAEGPGATARTVFHSKRDLLRRATQTLERGALEEGKRLLEEVESFSRASPLERPIWLLNMVRYALAAGDVRQGERLIAEVVAEAEASGNAHVYTWGKFAAFYSAILAGSSEEALGWSPAFPVPSGIQAEGVNAMRWLLEAQLGHRPEIPEPRFESIEACILMSLGRSRIALVEGNPFLALREAERAVAFSREHGLGLWEADSLMAACDATLFRAPDRFGVRVEELLALAKALPSARYCAEARFLQMLAAPRDLDPAELEGLAVRDASVPVAARRARYLLDPRARVDAVDRVVLGGFSAQSGLSCAVVRGELGFGWVSGWGLDYRTRSVWLLGERTVPLAAKPLFWSLLATLAEGGGEADKESLARAAWGVGAYHPLRDDKRLHVAVRRLRMLIEEDPSRPKRLLTTQDGYAFGDGTPVRCLRA